MEYEGRGRVWVEPWGSAVWKAAVVLALSFAALVVVPDRLLAFLSTRVSPDVRDALVATWVIVVFLALCVMFVRLQRRQAG